MMWLILSIICMISWGLTDILYKKGSPREDSLSCYKFMVWLGIIMGGLILVLLPESESGPDFWKMVWKNILIVPIPLAYPIAVMVGLNGKRYLDISVASPLENIDSAIASIIMLVFFLITGAITSIRDMVTGLDLVGIILVVASVILIGRIEQQLSKADTSVTADGKKRRAGASALIFPFIYSAFDAIATAASGIVLYDGGSSIMGEVDFLIIEASAFVLIGAFSWLYLWYKMKKPYNPFRKSESVRWGGGLLELLGNVCFTYAIVVNPVLVTPITSSYCIVTIFAARILLKEKLLKKQYVCLAILILGILILGISEGLK